MNLARSTYCYRLKTGKKALEREEKDADLKKLIDEKFTCFFPITVIVC